MNTDTDAVKTTPSAQWRVNGDHAPIVWLTAAKERIRWLSRALENAIAANAAPTAPAQSCGDAEQADAPMTAVAPEIQRNAIALLTAPKLPDWFDAFLTNVCEIPDRNSPDDEPDAIVATLEELRECALNAIANAPFDESASCDVEAAALRAFDHATKDGFSRDLESYCAGYIDRHYALPCAAEQADEAVTASWINGVAIELWKTADVAGFDDFKLAVGGFLRATADAARAKDSK
jgi:hypothetical protein